MKHLLSEWKTVQGSLRRKTPALFLDFDGTLSPITGHVDRALLPKESKRSLRRLVGTFEGRVAIVSGRSLKDLKKKIGIEELIYVGNHGLEIQGPGLTFIKPGAKRGRKYLTALKGKLTRALALVPGVLLEDKGLSISLHYRMARLKDIPELERIAAGLIRPYVAGKQLKVHRGKKVFEIKPAVDWHKGNAVLWLLKQQGFRRSFPIVVGDDLTDEDAFGAVKGYGLTIVVGRDRPSQAAYYLNNQRETARLLKRLTEIH